MEEFLKRREEEEKRQRQLFGLVAATIVNVNLPKGRRAVQPRDFFRERPKPTDFMKPAEAEQFMNRWARAQNAEHAQLELGGGE